MEKTDHGIDQAVILEAEIEELMRRLVLCDSNAVLRLEALIQKLRIERAVEKHCH